MKAHKFALFATILDIYNGFATLINDFERPTTPKVKLYRNKQKIIKAKPTNV